MLALVALLAVAAGWSVWWALHQVKALNSPGADQDLWYVVNIQRELQKLQLSTQVPESTSTPELSLRLEVLVSLLRPGRGTPGNDVSARLMTPRTRETFERIGEQVLRWADRLRDDPARASSISREVGRQAQWMVGGADDALIDLHLATTERVDADRVALRDRFALLIAVVGGLMLVMFGLIARLFVQSRWTWRLARHRGLLNRRLESRIQRRTRQLSEGKALLSFILDASPSEVALLDARDGTVTFINQRFHDRLGPRAKVGQPLALRDLFQAPAAGDHFFVELEQFGRVDALEVRLSGSTEEWVSLSAQLIEIEDGRLAHLVWCFDISAHKRLEDQLRALAGTDPLSGLENRRAFFDKGAVMLEHARRYGHPMSVLMLDLDHFKQINDTHGHSGGDDVIRRVAQHLRQALRESDLIARVGGEEFCALLPETGLASAKETAQRIVEHVRGAELGRTPSGPIRATLSVGVAQLESPHQTLQGLLEAADQALYAAKSGGRDRVVAAASPDSSPPPC